MVESRSATAKNFWFGLTNNKNNIKSLSEQIIINTRFLKKSRSKQKVMNKLGAIHASLPKFDTQYVIGHF